VKPPFCCTRIWRTALTVEPLDNSNTRRSDEPTLIHTHKLCKPLSLCLSLMTTTDLSHGSPGRRSGSRRTRSSLPEPALEATTTATASTARAAVSAMSAFGCLPTGRRLGRLVLLLVLAVLPSAAVQIPHPATNEAASVQQQQQQQRRLQLSQPPSTSAAPSRSAAPSTSANPTRTVRTLFRKVV
jgi:hypothetical protein